MKVITEESINKKKIEVEELQKLDRSNPYLHGKMYLLDDLLEKCLEDINVTKEENGQIIVDELRPMSDAPQKEWILVSIDGKLYPGYVKETHLYARGCIYYAYVAKGFIPMPIYRPKDGE